MNFIIIKYLITSFLVVFISEIAKRSDKLGGLIASLPIVTILTMIWLYVENQPTEKIANHAYYTFWYVIPTLPMFLIFPWLISKFSFVVSLGFSILITVICFVFFAWVLKFFGINLI